MTIHKSDALATAWTVALTAAAIAWLVRLEGWVTLNYYRCSGMSLPIPTKGIIDAVRGDPSVVLALVPAALSSLAVVLRARAPRAASVLLYLAPQFVLFGTLIATLAMLLPMFSFVPLCTHAPRN